MTKAKARVVSRACVRACVVPRARAVVSYKAEGVEMGEEGNMTGGTLRGTRAGGDKSGRTACKPAVRSANEIDVDGEMMF